MSLKEVRIIGIGKDLPGEPITNEHLIDRTNLTNESWTKEKCLKWVTERIGIETRHVSRLVTEEELHNNKPDPRYINSTLCANAITRALENAKVPKTEVDMIIVATATPDFLVPGISPIVQEKLGIQECAVLDVRSACCGSMTAFITAMQYLQTGFHRTIAVCGSDVGSVFGNLNQDHPAYERQDFVNALMIGDGAGAVILRGFSENEEKRGIEILHTRMNSIGPGKEPGMWLPLGGSVYPGTHENIDKGLGFFKHDYKAVMEHGPVLFTRALDDALKGAKLSISDIDLFVPHQANGSIPDMAPKFGVPKERMFHNFEKVGNTANASLMLCLADIAEQNTLPEGALVLVAAAESTKWLYCTVLLKWTTMTGEKSSQVLVRLPWWRRMYAGLAFFAVRSIVNSPLKRFFVS